MPAPPGSVRAVRGDWHAGADDDVSGLAARERVVPTARQYETRKPRVCSARVRCTILHSNTERFLIREPKVRRCMRLLIVPLLGGAFRRCSPRRLGEAPQSVPAPMVPSSDRPYLTPPDDTRGPLATDTAPAPNPMRLSA